MPVRKFDGDWERGKAYNTVYQYNKRDWFSKCYLYVKALYSADHRSRIRQTPLLNSSQKSFLKSEIDFHVRKLTPAESL